MSFINPAFFWAMFAVSVPIIIHLINFRRHKTLYFSNTRFLEDIKKETQTRTRLKHWLILAARILTIAMLVFAFAGPFIPNKSGDQAKISEVNVIYVDNSFSMEVEGVKGQLFEQARQIAKEIVYNSSASMEYVIITNDMLPENQFILNRDDFLRNLDKTKISSNPIDLNSVILKANSLIPDDKKASLYIISDMQESFLQDIAYTLNENIDAVFVPLSATKINNIFIDSCWFESPVHRLGQQEILKVRIVNSSDESFFDIPLQLYINDSLKALSGFNIEAGQTRDVEIEYVNTTSGNITAKLEITDYPVTYDNVMFFNYNVAEKTSVLVINGANPGRYLSALFFSDPENFDISQLSIGNVQSSQFPSFDLLILNNVSEVSSGLTSDLKEFVEQGGSLVLIPSVDMNINSINNMLSMFNAGRFDGNKFSSLRVFSVDYKHEVYRNVFQRIEKQTDLPILGLSHKYNLYNNSPFIQVVGLENNSSVLSAGVYGAGKFYVLAAPIADVNADFLKSPLFAPAFYNIAINSQINNSLYANLKSAGGIDINVDLEMSESDIFRITDNLSIDAVAPFKFQGKRIRISVPEAISIAGNFGLYKGENFITTVSLNYDRAESVLKYFDIEDLNLFIAEKMNNKARLIDANSEKFSVELKEFSEGKPLWQLFLIFALIFILCEVAIARFMR